MLSDEKEVCTEIRVLDHKSGENLKPITIKTSKKSYNQYTNNFSIQRHKVKIYTDYFYSFFAFIQANIKLYVDRDKKFINFVLSKSCYVTLDINEIQIFFGNTPCFSSAGNEKSNKKFSQKGARLCYLLTETGHVITILYPGKSDLYTVGEENIILRVGYYDTFDLLGYLNKDLRRLRIYQSISDIDIHENLYEKLYYKWLRYRYPSNRLKEGYYNYGQIIKEELIKKGVVTFILKIVGFILFSVSFVYYFFIK